MGAVTNEPFKQKCPAEHNPSVAPTPLANLAQKEPLGHKSGRVEPMGHTSPWIHMSPRPTPRAALGTELLLPSKQKYPSEQKPSGAELPVPEQNCPAGHTVQSLKSVPPLVPRYVPAGQGSLNGWDDPSGQTNPAGQAPEDDVPVKFVAPLVHQ